MVPRYPMRCGNLRAKIWPMAAKHDLLHSNRRSSLDAWASNAWVVNTRCRKRFRTAEVWQCRGPVRENRSVTSAIFHISSTVL